ncbi:ribose transport system ATP-binding protein [Olsenella profusa DSM 13989]|uniref:sugar ABC transporter ATP-binding protein n=1 Tax=Olsenella profusa TaxID=138595 RepID=UPI00278B6939|nr:sugar ABC transporter ATP-binding protein [Olsenella profusa]MDP9859228.1 ribose transport system ATP-binding protein [Olsenella profusa DSM 13989]
MGKPILQMHGITKSFGNTRVLKGVDFKLERGEVHALLGENGAGKSTLINVLGGVYPPNAGSIEIDGNQVDIDSVPTARRNGIEIIHQEIVLVPYLNIAQNIFLGREIVKKGGIVDEQEMEAQAKQKLSVLGVDISVTTLVKDLSIAQQQMVEIAKAVSFDARILVMDEPTSSLSDEEVESLFSIIRNLKKRGVSIVYISHRMSELLEITDCITVIRDGEYIGTVRTSQTNQGELVQMMVGRSLSNFYQRTYEPTEHVVFEARHLEKKGVFGDVSFQVHAGEILGFAGLIGAGRSELMQAIFGSSTYDSGEMLIDGDPVYFKNCADAIINGLALVPESRKKQGLDLLASVRFNVALSNLGKISYGSIVNWGKADTLVSKYIDDLHVKTPSLSTEVSSLSGGNQQKVVLAKWLATNPKVLILDEPTRGIDIGAKTEIYSIINELSKGGTAIILVSSELPELINMCDRICVVHGGRITGTLQRREFSQEKIMHLATEEDQ